MDYWIYRMYIWHLPIGMRIASLWNPKARKWINGRKSTYKDLVNFKKAHPKKPIWCHASSLGELEQVYPILQRLKKQGETILVSFFSPSGYEHADAYPDIDYYFYLPVDTLFNSQLFVQLIDPKKVLWVKYDFWFHFLQAIYTKQIPLYLVAATFTKSHFLLQPSRKKLRTQLGFFTKIFVQDQNSMDILQNFAFQNVQVTGDTRIDRVLQRQVKAEVKDKIIHFKLDKKLVVFASLHPSEFGMAISFIKSNRDYKYLIAPHHIDTATIGKLQRQLEVTLFTKWSDSESNVMILDTMGDLFSCYPVADLIYVGGGFDKGIHNTLEPAVFGKKIMIGPNFQLFPEAVQLVSSQLIQVINSKEEFTSKAFEFLATDQQAITDGLAKFFASQKGAEETIILSLAD